MEYISKPLSFVHYGTTTIPCFISDSDKKIERKTINAFGKEWKKFSDFSNEEIQKVGSEYFDIVDGNMINKESVVLDLGCGSGRWSKYIAPKVKWVEAIDAGDAVIVAAKNLQEFSNVRITKASAENIPFADNSFDFIFSLGVLHHIYDTQAGLNSAVSKLKKGGYFLIYLYYALENRGFLYRLLFQLSNAGRKIISSLPDFLKMFLCDLIAVFIYMPFILLSRFLKLLNIDLYRKLPLAYYCDKSFYIIRNDALDRFGTPLEKRFTGIQIEQMMQQAGLGEIKFSENAPYWHAVGRKL